jgi:hypothetical protein
MIIIPTVIPAKMEIHFSVSGGELTTQGAMSSASQRLDSTRSAAIILRLAPEGEAP